MTADQIRVALVLRIIEALAEIDKMFAALRELSK